MRVKTRALAEHDKEARRHALLDAAESLFLAHPERVASVEEVARAAGLAKGTVYLYFPSKEELLLSLHERHVARFFDALVRRLASRAAVDFDAVWRVTREHLVRTPGTLALASRCFGLMDRDIPAEAAIAFKVRMGRVLAGAGGGLEGRFPALAPGAGVTLLQHSYGLIVGLWQLMHPIARFADALERAELAVFRRDYERELEAALKALWRGAMEPTKKPRARPKGSRP